MEGTDRQRFLHPHSAGFATRKDAYLAGLRANLHLYPLILTVLAISAMYEASAVIAIMSLARR